MSFLLGFPIFRGYVKLRGGNAYSGGCVVKILDFPTTGILSLFTGGIWRVRKVKP